MPLAEQEFASVRHGGTRTIPNIAYQSLAITKTIGRRGVIIYPSGPRVVAVSGQRKNA
jgi:hypothetical protein